MGSVLLTAVFIALHFATGLANPDSKRLYDDLLSNYNRLIRPVGNNSDRLTVKMGLRLSQLIDVVSNIACKQNKNRRLTYNFRSGKVISLRNHHSPSYFSHNAPPWAEPSSQLKNSVNSSKVID